jgi:hypothetical protein
MSPPSKAPRPFFSWRWAVLLESDLPSTTKLVLLTLGCHMTEAGESCFPSVKTIAKEASLSRKAVMEHVKRAAAAGWIRVNQHEVRHNFVRNEYVISYPAGVLERLLAQRQGDRDTVTVTPAHGHRQ